MRIPGQKIHQEIIQDVFAENDSIILCQIVKFREVEVFSETAQYCGWNGAAGTSLKHTINTLRAATHPSILLE